MNYPDWKAVYIDKTQTLEQWQLQKTANRDTINNNRVISELHRAMLDNNISGEVFYPPPLMDLTEYRFDADHTRGDKHPHDVTEEQARKFIIGACFMISKYNGNSYNYYSKGGAAFVRHDLKTIRTAFKSEEYDDKILKLIEVYDDAIR